MPTSNVYRPDFRAVFQAVEAEARSFDGGGSGGDDGGMEARVAKLEATMDAIKETLTDIKTDIREIRSDSKISFYVTWGGIISLGIGLSAVMAKGFGWL